MSDKSVFFDASGKRRLVTNIVLPIIILIAVIFFVYTIFYVQKLNTIKNEVGTTVQNERSQNTNTAMIYTAAHPNAFAILGDRIEKLDTLIIPRYNVSKSGVTTPSEYQGLQNDATFVSNNKPIHYSQYYLLSSKNYILPPIEKEDDNNTLNQVDPLLPDVVNVDQMIIIRDDLIKNKSKGVVIDANLSFIKNEATKSKAMEWLSGFKKLLNEKDLRLGISYQPAMITKYTSDVISNADFQYITFNSNQSNASQIQKLVENKAIIKQDSIIEVPTVSTSQDTRYYQSYIKSIDYAEAQNNLTEVSVGSRNVEPIVKQIGVNKLLINDAIVANNIVQTLRLSLGDKTSYQYSISSPGFEEFTTWKLLENPYENIRNRYLLSESVLPKLEIVTNGNGQIYQLDKKGVATKRTIDSDTNNIIVTSKVGKPGSAPVVIKSGKKPKKIALTFDDGPHPTNTKKVLDVLDSYKVKGTFFLIGENVLANPSAAKEIVSRGHEVENHTYSHPVFSKLDTSSQVKEIESTSEVIRAVTGQKTQYFRKPYSDNSSIINESDIQYLEELKKLGLSASEYDIDSKDWLLDTSDEIVNKVKTDLAASSGEYSQILLHDSHLEAALTLEALPKIIEYVQSQGIEMVRVDELDNKVPDVIAETTPVYRAVDYKNRVVTIIIWINIVFLIFSILKYSWMIIGATAYVFKHRVIKFFMNRIDDSQRYSPEFTAIIACYNEEKVIARTLEALIDNTYKNFKILVIDDGSKDDTAKIVRKFARKHRQIKLKTIKNGGKAKALQVGIDMADSPWLVFCDADTIFDAKALQKFANAIFANRRIGAVAGRIRVGNDINLLTRSQLIEYGISHVFTKAAQDIINTITVVPGAAGLWKKSDLVKVGGFTTDTLAEDADTTMKIISSGHKVKYNASVSAKTEAPSDFKMLFKQRTRWQLGNMQAIYKHRKGFLNKNYGFLGMVGLPMFYFDIITALVYPFLLLFSTQIIMIYLFNWENIIPNNVGFAASKEFLLLSLSLILIETMLSLIVIIFEKVGLKNKLKLILTLPYYLLVFKTFLSIATIVSLMRAVRGTLQGWGHLKRTATVK